MAGDLVDILDTPKPRQFSELLVGEAFKYQGRMFTKTTDSAAENYVTGRTQLFFPSEGVQPETSRRGW